MRAVYFHLKRFDPQFNDFVMVKSLDEPASNKIGQRFETTSALIEDWMDRYPEGSVTITAEDK